MKIAVNIRLDIIYEKKDFEEKMMKKRMIFTLITVSALLHADSAWWPDITGQNNGNEVHTKIAKSTPNNITVTVQNTKKEAPQQKSQSQNIPEGIKYIKMLGSELKSHLKEALKADPSGVKALEFCANKAMQITKEVNSKLPDGASVRRTALRTRNPKNAPDPIDEGVMEVFEKAANEHKLTPQNIVKIDDGKSIRYYKPLLTQAVCLKCHGENVSDELKAKIKEFYPNDKALGFKNGAFRGVIVSTIKK